MREFIETPLKVKWWRRTEAHSGAGGGHEWVKHQRSDVWGGRIQRRFAHWWGGGETRGALERTFAERTGGPFITSGWRNNLAASGVTTRDHKLPLIEPNVLQVCESSAPANQEKLARPLLSSPLSSPDHLWKHTSIEKKKNTQRRPQQNPIRWHGLGSSNITLLFFY